MHKERLVEVTDATLANSEEDKKCRDKIIDLLNKEPYYNFMAFNEEKYFTVSKIPEQHVPFFIVAMEDLIASLKKHYKSP